MRDRLAIALLFLCQCKGGGTMGPDVDMDIGGQADMTIAPDLKMIPSAVISDVLPACVPVTGGDVTISGSLFLSGATVKIDGTNVLYSDLKPDIIQLKAPPRAKAGKVDLSVTNPGQAGGNVEGSPSVTSLYYCYANLKFSEVVKFTLGTNAAWAMTNTNVVDKSRLDVVATGYGPSVTTFTNKSSAPGVMAFEKTGMSTFPGYNVQAAAPFPIGGVQLPRLLIGYNYNTVSVLGYLGNGQFSSPDTETKFNDGIDATGVPTVAVADMDQDGIPDAVLRVGSSPRKLSVLRTKSLMPLTLEAVQVVDTNGDFVGDSDGYSMAISDVNGDKRPDVILASLSMTTPGVQIFINQKNNIMPLNLVPQPNLKLTSGHGSNNLSVTDLDGDGAPDIAVSNSESDVLEIFFNGGTGNFSNADAQYRLLHAGSTVNGVTASDVDGDGRLDILLAASGGVVTFLNRCHMAGGKLVRGFVQGATIATTAAPSHLISGDYDGDGKTDLVIESGRKTVLFMQNQSF